MLVCKVIHLRRYSGLGVADIAREVGKLPLRNDVVVDQTIVGKDNALFFRNFADPLIRVTITPGGQEDRGARVYTLPRTQLVSALIAAMQGGVTGEPIEVNISDVLPDAAALKAEIKAAPDSEDHADLFTSMAIAIWRAREQRKQIERGGMPPPRVILGYAEAKGRRE